MPPAGSRAIAARRTRRPVRARRRRPKAAGSRRGSAAPLPIGSRPARARTAISRRRLDSRASSRLAMLAQTISSRNPTAPISTISAGRDAPTSCSCAATTRALQPALLSLNSVGDAAASTRHFFLRLLRRSRPAPSGRPPSAIAPGAMRPCMSFGSNASGVHTSTLVLVGNSNAGGITPTTV